ncbi:NADH dehydrogenase FAD-containing subunit [Jatrophihabitans sp. GAS493]|uniref:NAD(P)/FAD-dependent oxidoreductase n=1 Tax=Jatrophihabitans sp. GAS493 TaxID=1907575 RepID=UPI000BB69456|nr:NAD(P)/FAD-dependent oxidoreductase [Jatrophihabitans sp. GAS493]SOD70638.1 NADH dehydrogenase FAD-containing subunit [Jatrophihabitans sp. GAS493]
MSTAQPVVGKRHHVVIIGSGFGGLFAAKKLAKSNVDVTLISRTSHHLFQPLLYQVATGILSEGEIAPATREILSKQKNIRVLLGYVTDIDIDKKTVTSTAFGEDRLTDYDSLIVAAGAFTSYFGKDEFSHDAPGLKSIDDALEVRGRIFNAFEMAELEEDPEIRKEWLTFVVVGAGPTGVEMAGQIAELAHRTLKHNFRSIDPKAARVVLVDAMGSVLSTFGSKLSATAASQLGKMGIDVWLNARVVDVDHLGLEIADDHGDHHRIQSRCMVWAAGVRASSLGKTLAEQSGAPIDRSGRIEVQPDLTLPGHPDVYIIGDMMSLKGYPGVAQVAMQGGKYAAQQIDRKVTGKAPKEPFHYFDKGSLATISRFRAVADVGKFRFSGFIAWVLWLVIHLMYLVGFKNRITTLLHWAVSFIGRGRSERTVTHQQVIARRALKQLELPHLSAPPIRNQDATAAGQPAGTALEAPAALDPAELDPALDPFVAPAAGSGGGNADG